MRRRILSVRRATPPAVRAAASARICAQLLRTAELSRAKCVAAFAPTDEETDIRPLLDECRRAGKQIALPRVCGPRRMTFHFVSADAAPLMRAGRENILQPPADFPAAPPHLFDFAIIPAVAVDSRRFRLGYGGGFYDTLLSDMRFTAFSCAAVFRCQRIAETPVEKHDRRVDMVISE
ncbi:MAG: 5-formyltetrahydrofolate cyclo-ligase [Gammaproteobacteria bacterium]